MANWIILSKDKGSLNDKVNVTVDPNMSSSQRRCKIVATTSRGTTVEIPIVSQPSIYTYQLEVSDIANYTLPASGGSLDIYATLITYRNGLKYKSSPVIPALRSTNSAFKVNENTISVSSRGSSIGNKLFSNITVYTIAPETGEEVFSSFVIYQQENVPVAINQSVTSFYYPTISPSDTSATPVFIPGVINVTLSSGSKLMLSEGSNELFSITSSKRFELASVKNGFNSITSSTGVLSASNMGTVLGSRESGTVNAILKCSCILSSSLGSNTISSQVTASALCTQGINEQSLNIQVDDVQSVIPASGGSLRINAQGSIAYTSGVYSSFTPTLSVSNSYFSVNGLSVVAPSRGAQLGPVLSTPVFVSYPNAPQQSVIVTQEANTIVGISSSAVSLTYGDVPASGGSIAPVINTGNYSLQYSSGFSTSSIPDESFGRLNVSYDYRSSNLNPSAVLNNTTGVLTVQSRGTIIGSSLNLGTVTVTQFVSWIGNDGSSCSTGGSTASVSVVQEANYIKGFSGGSVQISYYLENSDNVTTAPARGGNMVPKTSVTSNFVFEYSSGAISSSVPESQYGSISTSLSFIGMASEGFSAPQNNGLVVVENRGTVEGELRYSDDIYADVIFGWRPASGGSIIYNRTTTNVVHIPQEANIGVSSFDKPIINSQDVVLDIVPASGGPVTIRSITYAQSKGLLFTSGAIIEDEVIYTDGGDIIISGTSSGPNLGSTITSQRVIGNALITVVMNGKSSDPLSVPVTQEANVIEEETPTAIEFNGAIGTNFTVPCIGGTFPVRVLASVRYTSGTVVTNENVEASEALTSSIEFESKYDTVATYSSGNIIISYNRADVLGNSDSIHVGFTDPEYSGKLDFFIRVDSFECDILPHPLEDVQPYYIPTLGGAAPFLAFHVFTSLPKIITSDDVVLYAKETETGSWKQVDNRTPMFTPDGYKHDIYIGMCASGATTKFSFSAYLCSEFIPTGRWNVAPTMNFSAEVRSLTLSPWNPNLTILGYGDNATQIISIPFTGGTKLQWFLYSGSTNVVDFSEVLPKVEKIEVSLNGFAFKEVPSSGRITLMEDDLKNNSLLIRITSKPLETELGWRAAWTMSPDPTLGKLPPVQQGDLYTLNVPYVVEIPNRTSDVSQIGNYSTQFDVESNTDWEFDLDEQ